MADAATYDEMNPPPVDQQVGPPANHVSPVGNAASESTTIEQSRAIAEVQGAIVLAQKRPRSMPLCIETLRESCQQPALAEKAFFRFPRAGAQVSGASIHLAREAARCFGNIDYGIKELNRDDQRGVSEMLAFCWDMQTNTRNETTFLVPHKRDTKNGQKELTELRDIYENNANMGARRLRECIFATLPGWFVDMAKEVCQATLDHGGGKSLDVRRADAIRRFEDLKVTQKLLEEKVGRAAEKWTANDLAQLTVIYKSLHRGETTIDEEFPDAGQKRVTAADLANQAKGKPDADGIDESTAAATVETPSADADDFDIDVWKTAVMGQLQAAKGDRAKLQQLRQVYGSAMAGLKEQFPGQIANVDAAFDKAINAAPDPAKGQVAGQGELLGA